MNTQYTLGLTASPNRDDGLIFLVVNNCGPILYSGTIYDSEKLGSSIIPVLKPIFLMKNNSYYFRENESYHKIAAKVFEDKNAINFICSKIKEHYLLNDSQLCITQKVEESKEIMKLLIKKFGIKKEEICCMLGETELAERVRLVNEIKEGKIKIVISSKCWDKGVSANNLSVLHNIYPCKASANTIQRCGKRFNQICLIYKKVI